MRRKYKLMIIILLSGMLTYLIYFFNRENKLNLVAIGDGIASGETAYNIDGISFNDYVKDYFEGKKLLKNYNDTFAFKNYRLEDILNDLKSNNNDQKNNLSIQQIIHKADLLILSVGEEELVKLAITNDLSKEYIDKFMINYDNLLYLLKDITESKIIIISFYENVYLDKSNVIILNSELANLALKNNCIFININDLAMNDNYYLVNKTYYFDYRAHHAIAEMIIHSI